MNRQSWLAVWIVVCAAPLAASDDLPFAWRWVYVRGASFQVDAATDKVIELMPRAKAAGYNGIVIQDAKFARDPAERPPRYFVNAERVRLAGEEHGLELIPQVMPIGYSNDILGWNPNLAAAAPVRDCLFLVKEGRATVANGDNLLPFGAFEHFAGGRPDGWDWGDGLGVSLVQDNEQAHSGRSSLKLHRFAEGSPQGLSRIVKRVTLKPWHQYHLSLWIKTDGVASPGSINVILRAADSGLGRDLNRSPLQVAATQDWTRRDLLFNTFEFTDVGVYLGAWGAKDGTIWIDDASLRLVGGVNLLRREGCPVRVCSEDGAVVYEEGRDFERWEYPQMGRVPWPGGYEAVHPEPPIVLTADSRIREGQRLNVSYYHTRHVMEANLPCCLSCEELYGYLEQNVRFVERLFHPRKYLMNHDEIRLAGWDELEDRPGVTTGDLLAENVRRCTRIIRGVNPEAEILVWSDMFDPFHNAVDGYWHTRGTMRGSWEGVEPDVVIANWNRIHARESLEFFAGRGHRQLISGYYDNPRVTEQLHDWLEAAEGVEGIQGVLYTTWNGDYRHLEQFLQSLREWKGQTQK